jgi:hypothetical protein
MYVSSLGGLCVLARVNKIAMRTEAVQAVKTYPVMVFGRLGWLKVGSALLMRLIP